MITPPQPPEGNPPGPYPVPASPAIGSTGGEFASGPGVVAGRDPQPISEVEAERASAAGPDLAGGGGSEAGPDLAGGAGPDARSDVAEGGATAAGPDAGADHGIGSGADALAQEARPEGGVTRAAALAREAEPEGEMTRPDALAQDWEPEGEMTRPGTAGRGPVAEGFEGDPTAWPPDEAFDAVELDDRGWTRRDLEAILLVADEPVPAAVLAEIVGARLSEVEELLVDLAGEYARDGRGFVLRAIAGGWRLYTHPGAEAAVEAYLRAGQQSRLTRAALETLAVIAYRQPVTRFQVAAVRGVNVDGVFRTLASRGLIQEVGTDPGPGQATLYGTTPAFLEQLGLNDLDQLPPIKDYLPEGVDLLDLQDQP
jgi:segregation and condensation protein B